MIPLRISAKGFMCFRDEVEMQFDGAPLWMLTGNNGAGKSAVFDAILFALYGTHRKGTQNARFVINKESKNLVVEFDFAIGDDFFRVKRTLSRKGGPAFQAWKGRYDRTSPAQDMKLQEESGTQTKEGLRKWVTQTIGLDEKAFTASVFLRQGKGDALLTAEAEERHQILSQIVNLSKYAKLHERADEYHKDHKSQAKALQDQLQAVEPVDTSAIDELTAQISSTATTVETTRAQLDDLIALKVHAQNWDKLSSELTNLAREIEDAESLFQRSEQIESRAARAIELTRVLPILKSLFQDRNRLAEFQEQIAQYTAAAATHSETHVQATAQLREAQAGYNRLNEEQITLRRSYDAAHESLSRLTPQVSEIELLRKSRREVVALDERLGEFSPELEIQISASEQSLKATIELRGALPHLQHYMDARSRWRAAWQQATAASSEIERLSKEITVASAQHDDAEGKLAENQTALADAERRNTEAQLLFVQAQERLERLSQLKVAAKCEWCGQRLTAEHLEAERLRLDAELRSKDSERAAARDDFELAKTDLGNRLQASQQVSARVIELGRLIELAHARASAAGQNQSQAEDQARTALVSLPAEYTGRMHWGSTGDVTQCFNFDFPSDADLSELKSHASQQQTLEQQLAGLRRHESERRGLCLQRQAEADKVAALAQKYPDEQEAAVIDAHRLVTQELGQLKLDLGQAEQQFEVARRSLETARGHVETAAAQQQAAEREAQVTAARTLELSEAIIAREAELGENWNDEAQSLTEKRLRVLSNEAKSLIDAPEQLRQLRLAHDQQATRKARQAEVESGMAAIDERARCPVVELETEEREVLERHRAADRLKRQAEANKRALEERQQLRRDLEEKRLTHAQKTELYKQLATLLGRNNLQHHLLRQAEMSIVHNANNVLDRISGGTLRLELSGADSLASEGETKGKEKGGSKALDLVAYHSATRADELPVDFLSGSQRFRVAVSLALGIGQYASHGSRRIESVIIDEGFGSLDKQGCGEMIAELQRLKDVLGRIILVSHQEEVADAFPNNKYLVELIDGTSRVSLMAE